MKSKTVSSTDFNRVAKLRCGRWTERSIKVVRSLLVHSKRITDVAKESDMTPQQANVLRARFVEYMRLEAIVKVPAEKFMMSVIPANTSVLLTFKKEIKQLNKRGYSEPQIMEFLAANDMKVSAKELSTFLRAIRK